MDGICCSLRIFMRRTLMFCQHRVEVLRVRVGADVSHAFVPAAAAHWEWVAQYRLAVAAHVLEAGAASGFAPTASQIANCDTLHIERAKRDVARSKELAIAT